MTTSRPSIWFYILSVILLVWNSLGLYLFINDMTMSPEDISAMEPSMQAFYGDQIPLWSKIGYGMGTIGGFLGSIALLMRKRWAKIMYIISLLGILMNNYYHHFVGAEMDGMDNTKYVMPIILIVVAVIEILFSKSSAKKGWLNPGSPSHIPD